MQMRHHTHILPDEWRWVIGVSSALVLLALVPLLWIALRGTGDWQFMGMLHNPLDGASYLSKMALGARGDWLLHFQHTPETHDGAFIQVLYLLLGHVSRISGISTLVLFHVLRAAAALAMYAAIYQLSAVIWVRIRARRLFFGIAAIGSGLGWLLAPLLGSDKFPDLAGLPEAFPFYSTLMNPHFPLTIALLALLAAMFIVVFRPGGQTDPTVHNGWAAAGLLSVAVAFLYPQALVPFILAISLFWLTIVLRDRRIYWEAARWIAAVILPVLPIAAYYFLVIGYNPTMAAWNAQNVTPAPPLPIFLLGFGLPLLVGLPAIWRAVRHFEQDGDRLMLLWLIAIVVVVFLPTSTQRRFAAGLMLPIAYFAARAIEEVWLPHLSRSWRRLAPAVFFPLIAISNVFMLFVPALPAMSGAPEITPTIFLPRAYIGAFAWLAAHSDSDNVILASPEVSAWIPGWAGTRVVYGHPYETLHAAEREAEVKAWFAAPEAAPECAALLREYQVRYIVVGAMEQALGSNACIATLQAVAQSDTVTIYAP